MVTCMRLPPKRGYHILTLGATRSAINPIGNIEEESSLTGLAIDHNHATGIHSLMCKPEESTTDTRKPPDAQNQYLQSLHRPRWME